MSVDIKCVGCEYCTDVRRCGNTRGSFMCNHPDGDYMRRYFEEHNIRKMVGFIGFGKRFEDKPSIKTSPVWCPKKK